MKDIILIGIQGSGKGTQAKILAKKFGYHIFETGGALRSIAQKDSQLGRRVKEITERGDLVPNEIVMEIVSNFINETEKQTPIIFDGIPRSDQQRQTLETLLQMKNRDFDALEIRLSDEEALKRMTKRAQIESRSDDTPEVMQKRITNFYTHTAPLLEVWRTGGKLFSVDGEQEIDNVTQDILTHISE
jgi:adenylate kinase